MDVFKSRIFEYLSFDDQPVRIERGGLVTFVEPLPTQKEAGRDKGRLMVNCNCAAKGGNVQTDDFMVQPLHKK